METTTAQTKKITKATFKSFINKNKTNLLLKVDSSFDGMSDCVQSISGANFTPIKETNKNLENTIGIDGVWLVGGSRNYFEHFETDDMIGIDYTNSCGSGTIAIQKETKTGLSEKKKTQFKATIEKASEMDQIRKDSYLMGFAGPAAQTLRQDFIQYLTGERPAKAKAGIHRLIELINAEIDMIKELQTKQSEIMKYTLKGLQDAAKEMNKVLALDPEMAVNAKVDALIDDMAEAKTLIEDGDEFTPETQQYIDVIENIGVDEIEMPKKETKKPAAKKASAKKATKKETTEVDNEPEEQPTEQPKKETKKPAGKNTPKKPLAKSSSYLIGVEVAKNPEITVNELLEINKGFDRPLSKASVEIFRNDMIKAIKILKSIGKL
jgi:hypothetical protein